MRDMVSCSVDGDPATVFVEYEVDLSAPVDQSYVQPHVVTMATVRATGVMDTHSTLTGGRTRPHGATGRAS